MRWSSGRRCVTSATISAAGSRRSRAALAPGRRTARRLPRPRRPRLAAAVRRPAAAASPSDTAAWSPSTTASSWCATCCVTCGSSPRGELRRVHAVPGGHPPRARLAERRAASPGSPPDGRRCSTVMDAAASARSAAASRRRSQPACASSTWGTRESRRSTAAPSRSRRGATAAGRRPGRRREVPTLCHDDRSPPPAAAESAWSRSRDRGVVAACTTPGARTDDVDRTDDPAARDDGRGVLELLVSELPRARATPARRSELAALCGRSASTLPLRADRRSSAAIDSHPYVKLDRGPVHRLRALRAHVRRRTGHVRADAAGRGADTVVAPGTGGLERIGVRRLRRLRRHVPDGSALPSQSDSTCGRRATPSARPAATAASAARSTCTPATARSSGHPARDGAGQPRATPASRAASRTASCARRTG